MADFDGYDLPIKVGIYKLSWPDQNDYFYFGQSQNLWNRRGQHFRHLKNGTHDNNILQKLYDKYGLPEFSFVDLCPVSELNEKEQMLLDCYINDKNCCNLSPSAAGTRGYKMRESSKRLISSIRSGKSLSNNHRANISTGLIRAYENGRTKPDMSKENNPFYSKKHTLKTKLRMRGKSKGAGGSNNTARITLNLQNGIFYDFAGEAANTISINPQYLRRMLNGDRKNTTSFIYV